MIPNEEALHYLAVKKIRILLKGITSKNIDEFYCLNRLLSFRTKQKLEPHKRVCENKVFCCVKMSSKDIKILEFNLYRKFNKTPSIIYTDLEYLIKRIDGCKNSSKKSSTTKAGEYIPRGQCLKYIYSDLMV